MTTAVAVFYLVANGTSDSVTAYQAAQAADNACSFSTDNGMLDLGGLSDPDGIDLGNAGPTLAIWGRDKGTNAMHDLENVLQNNNDVASAADYRNTGQQMTQIAADLQSKLNAAAQHLGVTDLKPLDLVTLAG